MQAKTNHFFKIIMTSVLIALNIVLERFLTFQIESNHYSISVITIVFAIVYLGIPHGIAVAALGDIIGAVLFPIGPYFPGFTLTNILTALCIGLFLRNKVNIINTCCSIIINKAFGTLILNSIWVSVLYKGGIDAFPAYMVTRIPQSIIMTVVEIAVILIIFHDKSYIRKTLNRAINKAK